MFSEPFFCLHDLDQYALRQCRQNQALAFLGEDFRNEPD